MIYRDVKGKVLGWQFAPGERYSVIREGLTKLKEAGYKPSLIVCDGKAALIKAIKEMFEGVPVQRCLFHLVHQAGKWLTKKPKTPAAQTLVVLVELLIKVDTKAKAHAWNLAFDVWQELFMLVLKERSYAPLPAKTKKWWYTHRNLRRTWRLLKNAQPFLWSFLDFPDSPRTTNLLEGGINAPIKDLLRRHRGWSSTTQQQAIAWWFYFKNFPD